MSEPQISQPFNVLLIEDNPADVFITKEALKRQDLNVKIDVLEDGESALAYLRKEGRYGAAVTPDLVLLDLNVPKVGGHEILRVIRNTCELRNLLVVILSSSPEDVVGDAAAQASCYIQKPPSFPGFLAVGEKIAQVLNTEARKP